MIEEDFIVVTRRDGTIDTTRDIEAIVTRMGTQSFNDRALGAVAAVVQKLDGRIVKNQLNWREDSSPEFRANQKANADALLAAVEKAVNDNGDNGELKVKLRGKM